MPDADVPTPLEPLPGLGAPHITRDEFADVYAALAFANCQGYFVDAALDITWSLQCIHGTDAVGAVHHQLRHAIEAWLTNRILPALYFWVVEHGRTRGLHSHFTLHLPVEHEAAFRGFLDTFLPELVGSPLIIGAAGSTYKLQVFSRETTSEQWRRFKYLMKAVDPWVDLDGHRTATGADTLVHRCGIKAEFEGYVGMPRVGIAPGMDAEHRIGWMVGSDRPDWTVSTANPPTLNNRFYDWYDANVYRLHLGGPGRLPPLFNPFAASLELEVGTPPQLPLSRS